MQRQLPRQLLVGGGLVAVLLLGRERRLRFGVGCRRPDRDLHRRQLAVLQQHSSNMSAITTDVEGQNGFVQIEQCVLIEAANGGPYLISWQLDTLTILEVWLDPRVASQARTCIMATTYCIWSHRRRLRIRAEIVSMKRAGGSDGFGELRIVCWTQTTSSLFNVLLTADRQRG